MISNKTLVEDIVIRTNLSRDDAKKIVEAFIEAITYYISKGETVHILNLGTFEAHKHAPKITHNVASRKLNLLQEQRIPFFRASKGFKNKLK